MEIEMKIRNSKTEDFDRIMQIYADARVFMAEHGNPKQWGLRCWPPADLIRNDIMIGKSYVCVDEKDKILGVFYFDYGSDVEPTYRIIEAGEWKHDGPYGVVHRIASSGECKGVGTFCINWALNQCEHIRIDTHTDNSVMQKLLEKLGFEKCGIIHVRQDNDPRIAYEKVK